MCLRRLPLLPDLLMQIILIIRDLFLHCHVQTLKYIIWWTTEFRRLRLRCCYWVGHLLWMERWNRYHSLSQHIRCRLLLIPFVCLCRIFILLFQRRPLILSLHIDLILAAMSTMVGTTRMTATICLSTPPSLRSNSLASSVPYRGILGFYLWQKIPRYCTVEDPGPFIWENWVEIEQQKECSW